MSDRAALPCGVFVFFKSLRVAAAGDFCGGGFPEHRKDEHEVGHVVAEVLAVELFVARIFGGGETEGGLGNLGGENGVIALLLDAAFFPFVGELVADGDGSHTLFYPLVGIALGFVEGAGAFGGQLGIFDFLDAFVADFEIGRAHV